MRPSALRDAGFAQGHALSPPPPCHGAHIFAKATDIEPLRIRCSYAAIGVLALGVYIEAMEWIDLYPWNNIRGGNGQEMLDYIIAGVVVALAAWLWRGGRIPALVSAALTGAWTWLQISTWWLPYIEGATPITSCFNFWRSSPLHCP
ncbi:MAG: hypothetical protein KGJ53_00575 [Alphaproteobacteria bacterium]|nr:hypothetical protein [Alphaproteobacteria bacterium]MDE2161625.1 hypothetical protein [Alphaproteobacteria bacterium]